ncbi:14874_t:CDS:2, partial [Entrophospora sp. SA101]
MHSFKDDREKQGKVKERINDEKFPTEACVFLSIGKQHEGYLNIQKLAEQ